MSRKDDILALVNADPALVAMGRDYTSAGQIAAIISVGRTKLAPRMITDRGIIKALGPVEGNAFLTQLETFVNATLDDGNPLKPYQPGVKRMLGWVYPPSEGLDIGDEATQTILMTFGQAGVVNSTAAAALCDLAKVDDPFSTEEVFQAIQV